jgi:hypothetical protein
MTYVSPKKKAQQIINIFRKTKVTITGCSEGSNPCIISNYMSESSAIECAKISVKQIINSSPSLPVLSDSGTFGADIEESNLYWKEVLKEIDKY